MSEPAATPPAVEPPLSPSAERSPGLAARLGLAVMQPRWALTVAGDRRYAGRSGTDLIIAIVVLLAATQLRRLATGIWLGTAVEPALGLRAVVHVLSGALTVTLGLLVLGAGVVFAAAGPRRNLGRAFDLACVAALPMTIVDLVATVAIRTAGLTTGPLVGWLLSGMAYAWMGALIVLAAYVTARTQPTRVPEPPARTVRAARRLGLALAAIAVVGAAGQAIWIADNVDLVKPMTTGDPAPAFALPRIDPTGKLADHVALAQSRGKVTVLDFWATWCGPCLAAMPRLEKLARSHPEVSVLAINLDDAAAARAVFNERGYTMTLLLDDEDVRDRYGVTSIPHTVIIDRAGRVRQVVRGSGTDIAKLVDAIRD
ncbi:MAG TPA: TlpA disulfide reductase family protein [Kofleriaceae bacterium]|nr:TlpA disulfide reductase family protein [Kofleriaceae bacterium]